MTIGGYVSSFVATMEQKKKIKDNLLPLRQLSWSIDYGTVRMFRLETLF